VPAISVGDALLAVALHGHFRFVSWDRRWALPSNDFAKIYLSGSQNLPYAALDMPPSSLCALGPGVALGYIRAVPA